MEGLGAMSPAERYAAAADNFTRLVGGVSDWDGPSPVKEWTAREVVGHLVTWVPGMIGGGSGLEFPSGEGALADPVAAWRALDERLREVLADEELAVTVHSNPHTGQAPVAQVIDGYVTPDLVFHGWDLARASGSGP